MPIIISLFTIIVFGTLFLLFAKHFLSDGNTSESKPKKEQKTEMDYWYTHPYYFPLHNGKQINIPDYFTYSEWKLMNKEKRMQKIAAIENMLYSNNNYVENTNEKC